MIKHIRLTILGLLKAKRKRKTYAISYGLKGVEDAELQ